MKIPESLYQTLRARLLDLAGPSVPDEMSRLGMVALYPDQETRERIRSMVGDVPGAHPSDDYHVTMLFLGKIADLPPGAAGTMTAALAPLSLRVPTDAQVGQTTIFGDADEPVTVLLVDGMDMAPMHTDITRILANFGIESASEHGFTAHMTVADGKADIDVPRGTPLTFDMLAVELGDNRYVVSANPNEKKVQRFVRDAEYWGLPVGTPIAGQQTLPGMRNVPKVTYSHINTVTLTDGKRGLRVRGGTNLPKPLTGNRKPNAMPPVGYVVPRLQKVDTSNASMSVHELMENVDGNPDDVKCLVNDQLSERIYDHMLSDPKLRKCIADEMAYTLERLSSEINVRGMFFDNAPQLFNNPKFSPHVLETIAITPGREIPGVTPEDRKMVRHKLWRAVMIGRTFWGRHIPDEDGEKANFVDTRFIMSNMHLFDGYSDEELMVRSLVRKSVDNWAMTSGDSDARAIASQRAAADVFGLSPQTIAHFDDKDVDSSMFDRLKPYDHAFALANYWHTQELLEREGVDSINLYRGYRFDDYETLPSWIAESDAAKRAAEGIDAWREKKHREFEEQTLADYAGQSARHIVNKIEDENDDEFIYAADSWATQVLADSRPSDVVDDTWTGVPGDEPIHLPDSPYGPINLDVRLRDFDKLSWRLNIYRRWRVEAERLRIEKEIRDAKAKGDNSYLSYVASDGDRYSSAYTFGTYLTLMSDRDQSLTSDDDYYMARLSSDLPGTDVNIVQQPLNSWSTNYQTASQFAGTSSVESLGLTIAARVPRERIASTTITGLGCLNEHELIVLGGIDTVKVM